jgi:4-alpha-glucanotransferase
MTPDPESWGIATSYVDQSGREKRPPASTIDLILQAMGAHDHGPRAVGPLVFDKAGAKVQGLRELTLEDGTSLSIEKETPPSDLPFGYHVAHLSDGSDRLFIASPNRCTPVVDRMWGWALQLYALRSKNSWGIGDFGDLARFGRWARQLGAEVVMINPLHAPDPGTPQHPSPYNPTSRIRLNPLFIDISSVPGVSKRRTRSWRARRLNRARTIARDDAFEQKMAALASAFERFAGDPGFDAFVRAEPHLVDYATFAAITEVYGSGFKSWPAQYRHPDDAAVATFRRDHANAIDFHCFVQWIAARQLEGAASEIGLIADLAIGFDRGGADAWLWQDAIVEGFGIGAPADQFNTNGQAWGLPPFDPWKLRGIGYEPFISTLRATFRFSAGIRIDHVMGLFRQFWIPDGAEPTDGTYVRYPARDLLAILAVESHRAGAFVIGEDLGTVEKGVREEMAARDMLGYRVMWFEPGEPEDYPSDTVAVVSNHDLPTTVGLWTGSDIGELRSIGLRPNEAGTEALRERVQGWIGLPEGAEPEMVVEALYARLGRASSQIVLATVDDALAVPRRPNVPGTSHERPNWSIPLPKRLEELESDPLARRIADLLRRDRG